TVALVRVDTDSLRQAEIRLITTKKKILVLSRRYFERQGDDDFTWGGITGNGTGGATLVVRNGNITGSIHDGAEMYGVEPVGYWLHAIIEVNAARFPPEHPPSFRKIERRSEKVNVPQLRQDQGATEIDVLVAYTRSAAQAVGDIQATIRLAVQEANDSYQN